MPIPVTMPVNIRLLSCNSVSMSSPSSVAPGPHETRHGGEAVGAEGLRRRPAVAAHHRRGMEPGDAVHQVGAQQGGGDLGAAFHQHAGDAAFAPAPPTPPPGRCRAYRRAPSITLDAGCFQGAAATGVGTVAGEQPGRGLAPRWPPAGGQPACADGCRPPRAPGGPACSRAGGRSGRDRRSAPCRPRPSPRRAGRAARAPCARAGSPVIQRLSPDGWRCGRRAWRRVSASPAGGRAARG